jgi:hypothetical protein
MRSGSLIVFVLDRPLSSYNIFARNSAPPQVLSVSGCADGVVHQGEILVVEFNDDGTLLASGGRYAVDCTNKQWHGASADRY